MVTEFGMSEKLGPLQFGQSGGQVFLGRDISNEQNYSDKIAYEIDTEIQAIIRECYDKAKKIITENRDKLEVIAQALLKVETLNAKQIRHLYDHGTLPEEDLEEESSPADDLKVNITGKDKKEIDQDNEDSNEDKSE